MKPNYTKKNKSTDYLQKLFDLHKYEYLPVIVILIFILLKLYLVSGQTLFAITNAGHDDRLFLTLAENLLHFQWLGEYNNLTLAKGMLYPLWIAINFVLGLPLLFSEQLLYVFGSTLFILAVRPLIRNNWLLVLLFILILFNPISYANEPFTRVIREGIYVSLTLITLSSIIGLFVRRLSLKKAFPWAIFLGLSLSAFWLTREEGIWILPIFLVLYGFILYEGVLNRKKREWKNHLFLMFTPFLILAVSILCVSTINFYYYQTFTTVEFKSNSFVEAYGALSRVNHRKWTPYVPLPKETREKIYPVSPAFKELQPYLEGDVGNSWVNASGSEEIQGGWFMWALRDAVAHAGYYKDGLTSEDYYSRLASEINLACDENRIECIPGERNSMNPPWNEEYLTPFTQNLKKALFYTLKFSGFSPYSSPSAGNNQLMILFQDLTMENINPIPGEPSLPNQTFMDGYKVQILNYIGALYIKTTPILFATSLLLMIVKFFKDIKRKQISESLIIMLGLLGLLTSRILLISYIHTTSFSAINLLYLSPAHVVLITLVVLVWIHTFKDYFSNTKS